MLGKAPSLALTLCRRDGVVVYSPAGTVGDRLVLHLVRPGTETWSCRLLERAMIGSVTSFPAQARRVRDSTLSPQRRPYALRECALHCAPYGFRANMAPPGRLRPYPTQAHGRSRRTVQSAFPQCVGPALR